MQSTQFPEANLDVEIDFAKTKRVIDSSFTIRHGTDMKSEDKKIFFKQYAKQTGKDGGYTLDQNAKLIYKLYVS